MPRDGEPPQITARDVAADMGLLVLGGISQYAYWPRPDLASLRHATTIKSILSPLFYPKLILVELGEKISNGAELDKCLPQLPDHRSFHAARDGGFCLSVAAGAYG